MTKKTLTQADLATFTGSEQFYGHSINRRVIYTEGAQHVAEAGGAYWLLDEIALIEPHDARVAAEVPGLEADCRKHPPRRAHRQRITSSS